MQKTGHFKVLLQKIFFNVVSYGCATALALIAYLAKTNLGYMSLAAILSFFYASMVLFDVGLRFWFVLNNIHPDSP